VNYLDQLQLAVDHIETNLDHELPLAEVSGAAGVSRWHFQRIFCAVTGETLKTYIRARRLARSLERLADTDMRIICIAILAGFESQESFTRAFRKAFDMSPYQFRRLGRRNLFLRKAQFDADYLRHITTNLSMEPQLIEQEPMILVGCARGSSVGALPDSMIRFDLPAATYAHFTHRGPATDIDRTVNYIYSTWLTGSGYRHTYGPDLEIYGEGYDPSRLRHGVRHPHRRSPLRPTRVSTNLSPACGR